MVPDDEGAGPWTNAFGSGDDGVLSYAASSAGNLLVLITKHGRLATLTLGHRPAKGKKEEGWEVESAGAEDDDDEEELVPDARIVPWFEDPRLAPRCAAVSPGEDFLCVACAGGADLFVAPTALLAPGFKAKGDGGSRTLSPKLGCHFSFSFRAEKDCNFRSWSGSALTHVALSRPCGEAGGDGETLSDRAHLPPAASDGPSPKSPSPSASSPPAAGSQSQSAEPTSVLWWTNQEFG